MVVELPYTPAPRTGQPFIDTLMTGREHDLRRDELEFRREQHEDTFGLDMMRFHMEEDVAQTEKYRLEAMTNLIEYQAEELEILNQFIGPEKELNLKLLGNEVAQQDLFLNYLEPSLKAELNLTQANVRNVLAQAGYTEAEEQFFLASMPLRLESLELQNRIEEAGAVTSEHKVQVLLELAEEKKEATINEYKMAGVQLEAMETDLEQMSTNLDISKVELDMLKKQFEVQEKVHPHLLKGAVAEAKLQIASAEDKTAEHLARLAYDEYEKAVKNEALLEQANRDIQQAQAKILQKQVDTQNYLTAVDIWKTVDKPVIDAAYRKTAQELDAQVQHIMDNPNVFLEELLQDVTREFEEEDFGRIVRDAVAGEVEDVSGDFMYHLLHNWLGALEESQSVPVEFTDAVETSIVNNLGFKDLAEARQDKFVQLAEDRGLENIGDVSQEYGTTFLSVLMPWPLGQRGGIMDDLPDKVEAALEHVLQDAAGEFMRDLPQFARDYVYGPNNKHFTNVLEKNISSARDAYGIPEQSPFELFGLGDLGGGALGGVPMPGTSPD